MSELSESTSTPFGGPLTPELTSFMLRYKFGIDEILTKVNILREELMHTGDYCPIEHVSSRLKSFESVLDKAERIGCPPTLDDVRREVWDVAGQLDEKMERLHLEALLGAAR